MITYLFFRCLPHDTSIEVATDEVANDDAHIEDEYVEGVGCEEINGYAKIVESVGHTVGKATGDEQGNAEEQRQMLAFTGKGDCCSHDKSTTDSQDTTIEWTHAKTTFEDGLCRLLQRHGGASHHQGYGKTAHQVGEQDEAQFAQFTTMDEPCSTCVKLEGIVHYREESEREEYGSDDAFLGEIAISGDADAYTGQEAGTKEGKRVFHLLTSSLSVW